MLTLIDVQCHSGVSETLVAFIVKAIVLQPDNDFQVDRVLAANDVQRLIDLCVKRLLNTKSASLDTIKMQVYFDMNYTTREEFLAEHRRVLGKYVQLNRINRFLLLFFVCLFVFIERNTSSVDTPRNH
jgi:hypothetical protein